MGGRGRWRALTGAVAVLLTVAVVPARADSHPPDPRVVDSHPETGLQGQVPVADQQSGRSREGYWDGTRLVGSNDIEGLGSDIQLAWYRDCAYVIAPPPLTAEGRQPEGDGLAVLDVRNPQEPKLLQIIRDPRIFDIHEGLHVSEQRGILVTPAADSDRLAIYDVRNCRAPRLIDIVSTGVQVVAGMLKSGLHSGKLSPDGTVFYGTSGYHAPCVTAIDLRNLGAIEVLGGFGDFGCHDLDLSPDGKRAYLGWGGAEQLPGVFVTPLGRVDDPATGLVIADVSKIFKKQFQIISRTPGGRSHTETPFRVNKRSFVVATEEANCPGGDARIIDITDEKAPVQVAELRMEVNRAENCAAVAADMGDRPFLFYTSHYVSVDDPTDASLLFITHYASGLRVFDIRNPKNPVEIAYYNPPLGDRSETYDTTTTYVRWDETRRHMWVGSSVNGFQVIELTVELGPVVHGSQAPDVTWLGISRPSLAAQAAICALPR